jgi:hypothetical protein
VNPKQENFIMRLSFAVTSISTLLAATFFLSTPAAAIDARQAFAACDRNPKCTPDTGNDGGVMFYIEQADGSNDIVSCPSRGSCSCITCTPTRQSGGKGGKIDPARVLNASSTGTTGAGPKSPRVPPGNILDGGPGFSQQGPSGMGAPAGAPAAAPPRGPVLR